jgi:hypothetical protein
VRTVPVLITVPFCASPHNLAISPHNPANGSMMMVITCGRAHFLFLFVLVELGDEVAKHGATQRLRAARHITLPLRHIKAAMRTVT